MTKQNTIEFAKNWNLESNLFFCYARGMKQIDEFPTHKKDGISYRVGRPLPYGAQIISDDCVNFSIYSRDAEYCELVLYHLGDNEPFFVLPLEKEFRLGSVFSVMIFGIDWENIEYGYRFDPSKILLDPYAKLVSGRDEWHKRTYKDSNFQRRGRIIREDYNWEDDKPLEIDPKDLVIYEMHVRGFTQHDSSGVKYKGTFAGVIEKIPYLKSLGINCLELMPVFEFEEFIPCLTDEYCNY